MAPSNEYHDNLHQQMLDSEKFSNAIFYDLRYDIDQQASERTTQRLNIIDRQYGTGAIFGILANWAFNSVTLLKSAFPQSRHSDFSVVPFLSEESNLAKMEVGDRARISATQFVTAIANDDFEMAEAIFLAARNSSKEDAAALVSVILTAYINIYNNYVEEE